MYRLGRVRRRKAWKGERGRWDAIYTLSIQVQVVTVSRGVCDVWRTCTESASSRVTADGASACLFYFPPEPGSVAAIYIRSSPTHFSYKAWAMGEQL